MGMPKIRAIFKPVAPTNCLAIQYTDNAASLEHGVKFVRWRRRMAFYDAHERARLRLRTDGQGAATMTFRKKLLVACILTTVAAAGAIGWGASRYAQAQFDRVERQQTETLLAQFRSELDQRGAEIARTVQGIAEAEATVRMALELNGPQADFSVYADDARGIAEAQHLDFLELLASDGSLISSAQWPGRMGYRNEWVAGEQDWNARGTFVDWLELPDGSAAGMFAVRPVSVGESKLYILGGQRIDPQFLGGVVAPEGLNLLMYSNLGGAFAPAALITPQGAAAEADRYGTIVAAALERHRKSQDAYRWSESAIYQGNITTLPIRGRAGEVAAVVFVEADGRSRQAAVSAIGLFAAGIAACGLILSFLLSWWVSARFTRPLARLSASACETAGVNSALQVPARSRDEMSIAMRAFNGLLERIADERGNAAQAERVMAWREMARRMAHEVKDRLFPLQIAAENLRRTRDQGREQFDPQFLESMATLTGEIENLKKSTARFSDFAKIPAPRMQPVDVNELLRSALKPLEPEFSAVGRPQVTVELYLNAMLPKAAADPQLLQQALDSLLLRVRDGMPSGGTLTIRSGQAGDVVRIEMSHTGAIEAAESARMFTGYHAASQHAAGLGLATVLLIVSEHGGRVSASAAQNGAGNTFTIELPTASKLAQKIVPSQPAPSFKPKRDLPEPPSVEPEAASALSYRD
jgi:two-component system, NtrC family, nitrogen regulation sensor histidine kinase NtrY